MTMVVWRLLSIVVVTTIPICQSFQGSKLISSHSSSSNRNTYYHFAAADTTDDTELPTESQVIEAAKQVMQNTGYFDEYDPTLFADEFIFRGPVIGPLCKNDYEEVLEYFSIYKAFPGEWHIKLCVYDMLSYHVFSHFEMRFVDINPNCFGYSIDPDNPLRVWYQLRASGTYTQPLGGPIGKLIKPNGTKFRGSTETWSLTFTKDLKARLITAGYVSDRFEEDSTTDGIGLSFGILKTLGLSLPSGVGSALQLIQAVNPPLVSLGIAPKAVSREEDIPSWWKNDKRGADP